MTDKCETHRDRRATITLLSLNFQQTIELRSFNGFPNEKNWMSETCMIFQIQSYNDLITQG